ncbi:hypothetical protein ACEN2J_18650 [Pseudorhodobacter sp. W20_MBD10_FR17]
MRGADTLVEMLIGYGVDVVFGVPGDIDPVQPNVERAKNGCAD